MSESSPTEPDAPAGPGPLPLLGAAVAALVSLASLCAFVAAVTPRWLGALCLPAAVIGLASALVSRHRAPRSVLVEALVWLAVLVVGVESVFLILSRL